MSSDQQPVDQQRVDQRADNRADDPVAQAPAPRPALPTRLRAMLYMIPGTLLFLLNGVPFLLAVAAGELDEAYDSPLQSIAVGVVALIGVVLVVLGARVLLSRPTPPA